MKKLYSTILAVCLMCSLAAFSQDLPKPGDTDAKATADAPLSTLQGTVKVDGDKLTFVNDADQKAWDVMNPETLKAHEGHHVELSAQVYADKNTIHVMTVKMLKTDKPSM
jgi:hypothetical protein